MNRLGLTVFAVLFSIFFVMLGVAFAQGGASGDPLSALQAVVDALSHHNWSLAVAAGVVGAVSFLRWLAPKVHGKIGTWLNSNRGGAALAILAGIGATLTTAGIAGAHITLNLVFAGVTTGVLAIGGWNVVWDIFWPADGKESSTGTPKMVKVSPKVGALLPLMFLPLLSVFMAVPGCVHGQPTPGAQVLGKCEMASLPGELKAAAPCVEAALASPSFQSLLNGCGVIAMDQLVCIVEALTAAADGRIASTKTGANPVDLNISKNGHAFMKAHGK